jgi:hypothetical protein
MFQPILEVPSEMLVWMHKQSHSAFIGDMLRLIQRKGGLTQNQLNEIKKMMGDNR